MTITAADLGALLHKALFRRGAVLDDPATDCFRAFSGHADGLDGLFIDALGPAAVANLYEASDAAAIELQDLARTALDQLAPHGVRAVYVKLFPRDRSKLGAPPDTLSEPKPAAGEPQPDTITVREHGVPLRVKPYDGFSTGLFLDQRANRRWLRVQTAQLLRDRAAPDPMRALNTFAYTGAFGLNMALAGQDAQRPVVTTNADVSPRYLDWAQANYRAAGLDPDSGDHHFPRADARDVLALAERKGWRFGVIVLDPPSFGSGDKRRKIKPWRSVRDYPDLVAHAARVAEPGGLILCSTNTAELCEPGALEAAVMRGLAGTPTGDGAIVAGVRWRLLDTPRPEPDVARETGRFASIALRRD